MKKRASKKFKKLCHQEDLILQLTELIAETMDKKGINIKILAREMNVSQKSLKEFMRGDTDANLRMASDMMFAMDKAFEIKAKKAENMNDIFTIFEKI